MTLEEFVVSEYYGAVQAYCTDFKPHKFHATTTKLASDCVAYVTGEGLDDMLRRVVRRESEELFKQRKEITNHVIPCTAGRVIDVFKKVERTTYKPKVEVRGQEGEDKDAKEALIEILSTFHGGRPLDKYLFESIIQFNAVDPNAFIVIEWKDFNGNVERARPYPFEVHSSEVAGYHYQNGILKMLMVNQPVNRLANITVYLENQTIIFRQIGDDGIKAAKKLGMKDRDWREIDQNLYMFLTNGHYFLVSFPIPHNLGVVPAVRAGYIPNLANRKSTMVPLFHKAIPLFRKSIKANSELDLTMALAAFPLPLSYRDPCNAVGCSGGKLPDESKCGACKGTGWVRSTSVQEEMVFKKPKSPQDAFKLSDMMAFIGPPIDLITFQDKYLDDLSRRAISTVFNSDIFSRQEIADTATGKNISLQNVYDSLVALADHISWVWWVFVEIIAKITDLSKDRVLEHELIISKDFKLKGLQDVLDELKAAADSGASPEAIQALQSELMRLLLSDDEFRRYEVAAEFNPFRGLSTEQVQIALNSPYTTRRSKVLYLNLTSIISQIEREASDFYGKGYEEKKVLIDSKVTEIIAELDTVETPSML